MEIIHVCREPFERLLDTRDLYSHEVWLGFDVDERYYHVNNFTLILFSSFSLEVHVLFSLVVEVFESIFKMIYISLVK